MTITPNVSATPTHQPEDSEGNSTRSQTSQTYAKIRDAILSGELSPGSKLKIEALRERLGTGASPIREALSLLTSEDLVRRVDQRGFRVTEMNGPRFEQLRETRAWLEDRALRESIAKGDEKWEEGIVLAHYHLSRAERADEETGEAALSLEWEQRNHEFHFSLIAACGSDYLLRFCEHLYYQYTRYRRLLGGQSYPEGDEKREQEAIMKATLDRNADAAVEALLAHYTKTGDHLASRLV